MRILIWVLIALSALTFVFAVIATQVIDEFLRVRTVTDVIQVIGDMDLLATAGVPTLQRDQTCKIAKLVVPPVFFPSTALLRIANGQPLVESL